VDSSEPAGEQALRSVRPRDSHVIRQHASYGPVVVFRDRREPADATTLISQIFMGVRLECAKCHHHPNEKWSQGDFYQLAAFFAQMHRRGQGISPPISGEAEFIWFAPGGEVKHPLSGEVMTPKPPDGPTLNIPPTRDPREALATGWHGGQSFFARAAVNRLWGELIGRGSFIRWTISARPTAIQRSVAERTRP